MKTEISAGTVIWALALWFNAIYAQPEVATRYIYDHGRHEMFWDIYAVSDGGYIMCGYSAVRLTTSALDHLLVRISEDCDEMWSNIYGTDNVRDYATCVIETDSLGFLAGGLIGNYNDVRISALMVDRDGEQIWSETYGEGSCQAVIELKDGRFMLAGRSNSRGYLACIEYDGELIWDDIYGVESSCFHSMRETENGIVVAGYLSTDLTGSDVWVVKVDFNGEVMWSRIYDHDEDYYCYGMISLSDGDYVLAGIAYSEEENDDGFIMIIDEDGNIEVLNTYEFDGGYDHNTVHYLARTQNGNIIVVGEAYNNSLDNRAAAICLTPDGEELWHNIYQFPNYFRHCFRGVVRDTNDYIVACGWVDRSADSARDGLVLKIEPERPYPQFIYYEPEDTVFTVLQGDAVNFLVRVIDQMHREIEYQWTVGERVISTDSVAQYNFPDLDECSVTCEVTNGEFISSIIWHVTVAGLYIAAFEPDSLNLVVRRNSTVDFSIHVRTLQEPVNYGWTFIDRDGQRLAFGMDSTATYSFTEGYNCWMEATAWRGDFIDGVTWDIYVRSLIWWYWPEDSWISVPVDSPVDFEVVPFVLGAEDTLRYNWWLDGEHLDLDSTISLISVDFDELGMHTMMCVLTDTCDADTQTWSVYVYNPNAVVIPSKDYLPQETALYPPSPNPFNASATIKYDLPVTGHVNLSLYDLSGRLVEELVNGEKLSGRHAVELDGSGLAAGVYFVWMRPPLSPPLLRRGKNPASCLIRKAVVVK